MPVTMQQVLAEIDPEEPSYAALTALGPEALPHLEEVAKADDPLRAAKATYAASLIGGAGAVDLLRTAAQHRDPQVRVAAAHGLRNMADEATTDVVAGLLDDDDVGVRKMALGTAGHLNRPELSDKVRSIASDDPHEFMRDAATKVSRAAP